MQPIPSLLELLPVGVWLPVILQRAKHGAETPKRARCAATAGARAPLNATEPTIRAVGARENGDWHAVQGVLQAPLARGSLRKLPAQCPAVYAIERFQLSVGWACSQSFDLLAHGLGGLHIHSNV